MEWVDPLLRGLIGLSACAAIFAAAKVRFRRKGSDGAPADMGLD